MYAGVGLLAPLPLRAGWLVRQIDRWQDVQTAGWGGLPSNSQLCDHPPRGVTALNLNLETMYRQRPTPLGARSQPKLGEPVEG